MQAVFSGFIRFIVIYFCGFGQVLRRGISQLATNYPIRTNCVMAPFLRKGVDKIRKWVYNVLEVDTPKRGLSACGQSTPLLFLQKRIVGRRELPCARLGLYNRSKHASTSEAKYLHNACAALQPNAGSAATNLYIV